MEDFLVSISNLQEAVSLDPEKVEGLENTGIEVMREVLRRELERNPLPKAVEVSLVDDQAIAGVHGEFMGDPSPTDVITFPYGDFGEILISVETAKRQGRDFKRPVFVEVTLYLIHGILHLAGYDDQNPQERKEMERIQEDLLTQYL